MRRPLAERRAARQDARAVNLVRHFVEEGAAELPEQQAEVTAHRDAPRRIPPHTHVGGERDLWAEIVPARWPPRPAAAGHPVTRPAQRDETVPRLPPRPHV